MTLKGVSYKNYIIIHQHIQTLCWYLKTSIFRLRANYINLDCDHDVFFFFRSTLKSYLLWPSRYIGKFINLYNLCYVIMGWALINFISYGIGRGIKSKHQWSWWNIIISTHCGFIYICGYQFSWIIHLWICQSLLTSL